MTRVEGRFGTYTFPDESARSGWRSGCAILLGVFTVGYVLGLLTGVNVPRAAPVTTPRPEAAAGGEASVRVALTATVAIPAPVRTSPVSPPAQLVLTASTGSISGTASYVAPAYGPLYLALPQGPGIRVTICGRASCVNRTSTDAGPALFRQRQGRVADLSFNDFGRVCGCAPKLVGLTHVTVAYGPRPTPPATDTGGTK